MQQAIFIIGISPRCGTNFLYKSLLLHPQIVASRIKGEDFFLTESDLLIEYTNRVHKRWKKEWGNDKNNLLKSIGEGLINALQNREMSERYVITKTPLPTHLENFSSLFGSDARLILLCRKGQDICESYRKSFQPNLDKVLDLLEQGATTFHSFLSNPKNQNYLLVRYEDLFTNFEAEITKILIFLALSKEVYPMQEAYQLEIVGSSTQRTKTDDFVWRKLPRTGDFNPTRRAEYWSKWEHLRFNYRVGDSFKALGYSMKYDERSTLFYLYNWYCNIKRVHRFFIPNKIKLIWRDLSKRFV